MSPADRIRFGDFEADVRTGELWRAGARVRIQDLPFRLLAVLLETPGELVSRADLGQRLWGGDTFVDFEAGLNTAVAKLREALDDESATIIQTVPKRGYRFAAPLDGPSAAPVSADPALSSSPPSADRPSPVSRPSRSRAVIAALLAIAAVVAAALWFVSRGAPVRVAVVLFDNETDRAEFTRLAQTLTDSVVLKLGGNPRLAVIGNAQILRTDRPFRDLAAIRAAVNADFIVIGQVQAKAEGFRVMTHLIRASDSAHVWVKETLFATGAEAALERDVVNPLADAISKAPRS